MTLNFAGMQRFTAAAGADLRSGRYSGHFAGLSLIGTDAQREPNRRARGVVQQDVEAMLGDRARQFGIAVRREVDVTDVVGLRQRRSFP